MTNIEALWIINPLLACTLGFTFQAFLAKSKWSYAYSFSFTLVSSLLLMVIFEGMPLTTTILGYALFYGVLAILTGGFYKLLKKMLRIYYLSRYR